MASSFSPLKIQLMATGENLATWGNVTNANLGTAVSEAIVGSADVTFASADQTLTLTNTNSTQVARNMRLNLVGTTGGVTRTLTVPAIEKIYVVNNGCLDTITIKNATGTGMNVPAGKTMWVYNDGNNVVDVVTHLSSLTLVTALPVASGGTGSTSGNASALTGFNAANVSAGILSVEFGGTGVNTITGYVKGAGTAAFTGSGTIPTTDLQGILSTDKGGTGVDASLAANGKLLIGNGTGFTLATLTQGTGVTITNGAGSISISATGTGGTVTSVDLSGGTTGLNVSGSPITTSGTITLSGTLVTANGGTGLTTFSGSNQALYSSNATTLVAGTLPLSAGGTGQTTAANAINALLPAQGGNSGKFLSTNGSTTSWQASTGGSVTSVGMIVPSFLSVSPSSITTSGTFTVSFSGVALPVANGGTGLTSFLAANNALYSSSSSVLTAGTLPIAAGGTGGTTATTAINNLLPTQTGNSGKVLSTNGTAASWVTGGGSGTVTSVGGTGSVNGLTLTGTVTTTGNLTLGGSVSSVASGATIDSITIGYRNIPQLTGTTVNATVVGKHFYGSAGITIPSGVFSAGDAFLIINSGTSDLTITQGAGTTLRLVGTATTGSRTLAQKGIADIICVASNEFIVSGVT